MSKARPQSRAGFTLVELMIGLTLAAMVMTAVLASYVTLGRSFTRLLGINSPDQINRRTLETQGRLTLQYFERDVRMAISLTSPSDTSVTLNLPTSSGTTTMTVAYAYNSTAKTLTRTPSVGNVLILHYDLQSFDFNYYDTASSAITDFTNKISSIKQISMTFSSQTGNSANGTLTQLYRSASPRLLLRNKQLLP